MKLVDRLRTHMKDYGAAVEAADRIEALEAALRAVRDFPYIGGKAEGELAIIAAALAPEQDK
jgi:plasmid stabilization system protein ParE